MNAKQFDFGKNWLDYSVNSLSADKVERARLDFANLLAAVIGLQPEATFLDIGFGQGLSLCVASERFDRVVGCDINPKCKEAVEFTRTYFPDLKVDPDILIGSIVDEAFVSELIQRNGGKYDVVHSWGVLHHTGHMRRAIANAASLVAPGGTLIIAIYNKHWTSYIWRIIKRIYVDSPKFVQLLMVWSLYSLKRILQYRKNSDYRGMDFYHDIVDWVGGYPYEFASKDEIIGIMRMHGFDIVTMIPTEGLTGCNEFVFQKV
jgi:2-polyprenyl-3-methyl-5-hydroxy-6-metoxy-1,4-benzoquinol methylase